MVPMATRRLMAAGALLAADTVHAQDEFPNRPVHILVGFTAGSGTDFLARMAEVIQAAGIRVN
jgi:tripartite-type tricarboxylate transporter receptor subunit TctC